MPKIFISYRREDSNSIVGRIYDRLVEEFGKKDVFKDVDSIPLGSDFRQVLSEVVNRCDVVLAVIGRGWLDATDRAGKKRLAAKSDFVRVEIEAALERGIPVIPVLVDGAAVPTAEELPETLRDLSYRHGTPVRYDPDFHTDMERLVAGLKRNRPGRTRPVATQKRSPRSPSRSLGTAALLSLAVVAGLAAAWNWWPGGPAGERPRPMKSGPKDDAVAPKPAATDGPVAISTPPGAPDPTPPRPANQSEVAVIPAGETQVRAVFGRMPHGGSGQAIGVGLWLASPISRDDLLIFERLRVAMVAADVRLACISSPTLHEFAFLGDGVSRVEDPRQLLDRKDVDVVIIHGLLRNGAVFPTFMGEMATTPFQRANLALIWSSEAGHDSFLVLADHEFSAWKPERLVKSKLASGQAALEASRKYQRIVDIGNVARGNDFAEFFSSVKSRTLDSSHISKIIKE